MKKMIKVSQKLNLFIITMITLLIITGSVITIMLFNRIYEEEINQSVELSAEALYQNIIIDRKKELVEFCNRMEHLSMDMEEEPKELQVKIWDRFVEYTNLEGLTFLQLYEEESLIYERSIESILDEYQQVPTNDKTSVMIKGTEDKGILMVCSMPWLLSSGEKKGMIRVGIQLAKQSSVEYIKKTTGHDATIFSGEMRYATTISKDGILAKGQLMDRKIYNEIMVKENAYIGRANVIGEDYYSYYIPIVDSDHHVIGAVAAGTSLANLEQIKWRIIILIGLLNVILLVFFTLWSSHWLKKNISRPIDQVAFGMFQVAKGNYVSIENKKAESTLEFAQLKDSLNTMAKAIKEQQSKLEQLAYHDTCTGMSNRAKMFATYRSETFEYTKQMVWAIYYLDLDNFKYINHLFGKEKGDQLLQLLSQKLNEYVRDESRFEIFKVAGDEFVLCYSGFRKEEELVSISTDLLALFKEKFDLKEYKIHITASLGMAMQKHDGKEDFESLFEKAEIALNQAKSRGKNQLVIFDPIMNVTLQKNALIQQELRTALSGGEIYLVYQPKYNVKKHRFDGFEALIRWKHPKRGMVSPLEFIRAAEETNQIHEIGRWVLETACSFIAQVNKKYTIDAHIAVNVSAVQLLDESFEQTILDILEKYQLEPEKLELEITESVLIHSFEIVNEKLLRLRAKKINIALDDFGTGYSSLNYIKALPITTLKLDKTFSDDIVKDQIAFEIVESVVKIAKSTGLTIVVEGIEKKEQLQRLEPLECDYIQGYYFSKPLTVKELEETLVDHLKIKTMLH